MMLAVWATAGTCIAAVGELAMRWRFEGGGRAALRSLLASRGPSGDGRDSSWLRYDAELGYTLNPGRFGANSLGIKHGEIPPGKPPGLFRLIVLGDSVAAAEPGFVDELRERLPQLRSGPSEVINAAIPGYTTYQERLLLERRLLPVQPDLVLLQYCLNDNHRFLHRLDPTGRWLMTQEARAARLSDGDGILASLTRSSYLVFGVRLSLRALTTPPSRFPWERRPDFCVAWQDATWPTFEEHLLAMRGALARAHARLAVVMVPYEPQLDRELLQSDRAYTLRPQSRMAEICNRVRVPLLDLHPAFLAGPGGLYKDGIHLTPAGHGVAARELVEFLVKEGLVAGSWDPRALMLN